MSYPYPYPGDDPATLSGAGYALLGADSNMKTFFNGVREVKGQLNGAWQDSTWAARCQGDLQLLSTLASTVDFDLDKAQHAIEDYRAVLVPIRCRIDDMRRDYVAQSNAIDDDQDRLARRTDDGTSGEQPGPPLSPAEHDRVTSDINRRQGILDGYDREYNSLVSKADAAAATCSSALAAASTGQQYNGSTMTTVSLDQAFGLSRLTALHQQEMRERATKLAAELLAVDRTDGKGANTYDEIAHDAAQYVDDPDFAATFYGSLGPQATQFIPAFLYASGSSTAAYDLNVFSQLLGAAVSHQSADPRMAVVANSFLNTAPEAQTSWYRAALLSSGTFPSTWLAEAARYNALDVLAKNGSGGFNGVGFNGEPVGIDFYQQLGLPSDVVAIWNLDLSHNPQAARDAFATMGSDDPTNVRPPTGPDAWKAYSDNIHALIQYGRTDDYPGDVPAANAAAFAAAAGANDEVDGAHSAGASAFAQALFNDLGSTDDSSHLGPGTAATGTFSKIAASYVQEMAAGYGQEGTSVTSTGYPIYPDQQPAFGVPPELVHRIMATFVGDPDATAGFDTAAGSAAHHAMVAAASVDAHLPAASADKLNHVSEAYGAIAGQENATTREIVGAQNEAEQHSRELIRGIISAGVDLIPGEKIAESVPGTVWDILKHTTNMGLEQVYGETGDPRFDALNDTGHAIAVTAAYNNLSVLQEAGYPGTENIPGELLDQTTGMMRPVGQVLDDPSLQESFNDYLTGAGAVVTGDHVSVTETAKTASGRYLLGFETENGPDH